MVPSLVVVDVQLSTSLILNFFCGGRTWSPNYLPVKLVPRLCVRVLFFSLSNLFTGLE